METLHWRVQIQNLLSMAAQMSVLGPIRSYFRYLRSAQGRFPFSQWVNDPFPQNLQNAFTPKPARELTFWEKVHLSPLVTCHVSHVRCHVSHVTRHLSHITCHMSHKKINIYIYFFFGQSGEARLWRVCYKTGLPCLVFTDSGEHELFFFLNKTLLVGWTKRVRNNFNMFIKVYSLTVKTYPCWI